MKKKTSFTLSDEAMRLLRLLSENMGVSMSAVLEVVLREKVIRERDVTKDEKIRYCSYKNPFDVPKNLNELLVNYVSAIEAFDAISKDNDSGTWRNGKQEEGDLVFFDAVVYFHGNIKRLGFDVKEIKKKKQEVILAFQDAVNEMYADETP